MKIGGYILKIHYNHLNFRLISSLAGVFCISVISGQNYVLTNFRDTVSEISQIRYFYRLIISSMKLLNTSSFVLICIFFFLPVYTQEKNFVYSKITTDDGLPFSMVKKILADVDGFLWISTGNGLARYDGFDFKIYTSENDDGIRQVAENNITDFCISKHHLNLLYVGTYEGFTVLDTKTDFSENFLKNRQHPDRGPCENKIIKMDEDNQGILWIATDNGFCSFNPDNNKFKHYRLPYGSENTIQRINSIAAGKNGIIWLRESEVIYSFDIQKNRFNRYLIDNNVYTIAPFIVIDNDNNLYISVGLSKLQRYNSATDVFEDFIDLSQITGYELVINHCYIYNNLMNISTDCGLVVLNPDTRRVTSHLLSYTNACENNSAFIGCSYTDHKGIVWLGTDRDGMIKIDNYAKKFRTISKLPNSLNTLSDKSVYCMTKENEDVMWIGTHNGGLNRYDKRKGQFNYIMKTERNSGSLTSNKVFCILIDSRNNLWIGGGDGVSRINLDEIKNFFHYPGDVSDKVRVITYRPEPGNPDALDGWSVRNIMEDRYGTIWFSVFDGGLSSFDYNTGKFRNYRFDENIPGGVSEQSVKMVYEAPAGWENHLWIGSLKNGLILMDCINETFRYFRNDPNDPKTISGNNVSVMMQDASGDFWIGTSKGLDRMIIHEENPDSAVFINYGVRDGLPDSRVNGIFEDKKGFFWISTEGGLTKFDPVKETFLYYGKQDGIQEEFFFNSYFEDKQTGELFFGGLGGITHFFPDSIHENPVKPGIAITGLKIMNREIEPGDTINNRVILTKVVEKTDQIVLTHKEREFTFTFAALHYANPSKNEYQYILEGYDKEWKNTGSSDRKATYANLPAGKYLFRVKGSNNDGLWTEKTAEIAVIIKPPLWGTKIAYFFYMVFFLVGGLLLRHIILLRTYYNKKILIERIEYEKDMEIAKKAHELDQMKIKFFMNVSHEFRTPLTLIMEPLERLGAYVEKDQKTLVDIMIRNANRLLRLVNQLLDIRKLETKTMKIKVSENDVPVWVKNLYESFRYMADRHNIKYHFSTDKPHFNGWFDHDILEKVIYNLLSNAFKYTPDGGRINVSVSFNNLNNLLLEVSDTGIGIAPENLTRIFDRFYTINNAKVRKISGTGIGLALTKELVELHKGIINVESIPDEGTKFSVIIPVAFDIYEEDERSLSGNSAEGDRYPHVTVLMPDHLNNNVEEEKSLGKKENKILIVDDNPDIRLFIKNELKNIYEVFEADNGKEGIEIAKTEQPDLIISDVMMPVMDGNEFVYNLKNDDETSHIPVILLTARSGEDHQLESFQSGADDYVVKPFNSDLLLLKIENFINTRRKMQHKFKKYISADPGKEIFADPGESFIIKAMEFLEDNLENSRYGVEELSADMGMHRTHFFKKIKYLTGDTPFSFIQSIRLKKAIDFLENSNLNISEISYKVGFSDPVYFARVFKEKIGVPPTGYRRMNN